MPQTESRSEAVGSKQAAKVVLLEGDAWLGAHLKSGLELLGLAVLHAKSGREALSLISLEQPDLFLVDLERLDVDGKALIAETASWSRMPIIALVSECTAEKRVAVLDSGAVDVVTKPFDVRELAAKIASLKRFSESIPPRPPQIKTGKLVIDPASRSVTLGGQKVRLSPREYELLGILAAHPDRVLTHEMLSLAAGKKGKAMKLDYLRIFVGRLRQKLEANPSRPKYIVTESGVGYCLRLLPPTDD